MRVRVSPALMAVVAVAACAYARVDMAATDARRPRIRLLPAHTTGRIATVVQNHLLLPPIRVRHMVYILRCL